MTDSEAVVDFEKSNVETENMKIDDSSALSECRTNFVNENDVDEKTLVTVTVDCASENNFDRELTQHEVEDKSDELGQELLENSKNVLHISESDLSKDEDSPAIIPKIIMTKENDDDASCRRQVEAFIERERVACLESSNSCSSPIENCNQNDVEVNLARELNENGHDSHENDHTNDDILMIVEDGDCILVSSEEQGQGVEAVACSSAVDQNISQVDGISNSKSFYSLGDDSASVVEPAKDSAEESSKEMRTVVRQHSPSTTIIKKLAPKTWDEWIKKAPGSAPPRLKKMDSVESEGGGFRHETASQHSNEAETKSLDLELTVPSKSEEPSPKVSSPKVVKNTRFKIIPQTLDVLESDPPSACRREPLASLSEADEDAMLENPTIMLESHLNELTMVESQLKKLKLEKQRKQRKGAAAPTQQQLQQQRKGRRASWITALKALYQAPTPVRAATPAVPTPAKHVAAAAAARPNRLAAPPLIAEPKNKSKIE
ncbi:hypothetical protein LSTR_LSTR004826, partial [Laodelphax striatellus]